MFAVAASRAPLRTAFALRGGLEAHECPGGPLIALIPPSDVVVLTGSSYEGHLGRWRAVTWDEVGTDPVTRFLWVADKDLRAATAVSDTLRDGKVFRDPAFDFGCNPDPSPATESTGRAGEPPERPATTEGAEATPPEQPGLTAPDTTLATPPEEAPPRAAHSTTSPPTSSSPTSFSPTTSSPQTSNPPPPPVTTGTVPPPETTAVPPPEATAAAPNVVPDVRGLEEQEAARVLADHGFEAKALDVSLQFNDSRIGDVVTQLPEPGSIAAADSIVTIGVGRAGPVQVPDLIGLTEAKAIDTLETLGLKAHPTPDECRFPDSVADQSSAAGSFVAAGATVEIIFHQDCSGGVD